jgi:N6-L-threonylcarbamoyladenine synthase
MLFKKLLAAAKEHKIKTLAIAGGVSANSLLRKRLEELKEKGFEVFIPPFEYCTDNAAMIGITAYFKYLKNEFCTLNTIPAAQYSL